MLLTRLPVGRLKDPAPSFADAAWAYPVAGALVGAISGAIYCAFAALGLPALAAALLAIGAAVLATGALHEDGLADVADGFGGGGDTARKLEIMRDSRVGTYGVVAVVLAICLLASAVASLTASLTVFFGFVAIGALSRAMMLVPMTFLPPARADGLGAQAGLAGPGVLLQALGIALVLSLPVFVPALIATWVMGGVAFGLVILARRQIGGQSGDVLGATQKLTEVAGWLVLAIFI
ncbi:MAG: adenosylcobinamide-GDP ribazoletransferase [Silicimonas sp.]|nr:adenosylcobinamide-GDP ribazoletransferase [Silicimonas sp.]